VHVTSTLQTVRHEFVFAAGDCASFTPSPLAKSGVFAVRQGPVLEANLRAYVCGLKLQPFVPQHSFLGLVGTHNGTLAMASKGEMAVDASKWLWALKEWIDRTWMASYQVGSVIGVFVVYV
jgi:selenide,water dikinase